MPTTPTSLISCTHDISYAVINQIGLLYVLIYKFYSSQDSNISMSWQQKKVLSMLMHIHHMLTSVRCLVLQQNGANLLLKSSAPQFM